MRSSQGSFSLTFLLPADFRLSYDGTQPGANGCLLATRGALVEVSGPSREAVLNDATPLLRTIHGFLERPFSITAVVRSPPPVPGVDSWSIIVGADVAFSPTSLDPHFPRAASA